MIELNWALCKQKSILLLENEQKLRQFRWYFEGICDPFFEDFIPF